MGEHSLKSHASSSKHKMLAHNNVKGKSLFTPSLKHYFTDSQSSVSLNSSQSLDQEIPSTSATSRSTAPSVAPSSVRQALTGDDVLRAEIYHALNLIEKHHSYSSSSNASELYRLMFPDSNIAAGFQCGDRKSAYMTTFGIAPYLERLEMKALQSTNHYVLLFDESLNDHLHLKQLDTHVRHWVGDVVQTRYLTLQFLGHAKSVDLHEHLRQSWETMPIRSGLVQSGFVQAM